jgi:hypothetical protein
VLYLDGTAVASATVAQDVIYDTTSAGDVYMGQDPGPAEALKGTLDSVTVWGRALAASEVAALATPPAPEDTTPPTVSGVVVGPVTAAGNDVQTITVTYSDQVAVDGSTLDSSDLLVTGPNGYSQLAVFDSVNAAGNGATRTATYHVAAPGGSWDLADNGTYTLSLQAGQVRDTAGNPVPVGAVGTFSVNILDTTPPVLAMGTWKSLAPTASR